MSADDATRCPKCDKPGKETRKFPAPKSSTSVPGAMIVEFECVSTLCPWFETLWMVQINPDGSIPEPSNHRGRPKTYLKTKEDDRMAQQIRDAIDAQIAAETRGHGEIRNPYA